MSDPQLQIAIPDELVDLIARRVLELLDERAAASSPPRAAWLTVEGAAAHLNCSRQRVYDLVHAGALKPGRDGRRLLFRASDIDRYLEANGGAAAKETAT